MAIFIDIPDEETLKMVAEAKKNGTLTFQNKGIEITIRADAPINPN
jgi:hypothetical protein